MTCEFLGIFQKASVDVLDYDIDFSRWLPDDDTVASATASVQPAESMVSVAQIVVTPGQPVKVWLIDGVSGMTATVGVVARTTQGRTKQVEFQIRVRN